MNIFDLFKKRQFKYGGNTLVLILIVIGITGLLNFIIHQHNISWDLTENKRFSLSDQTKQVLTNLDQRIKVIGFFQPGSSSRAMVEQLLNQYEDYTDKLDIEFIDPDKNPAKAKEYNISSYGTTVFETSKRQKKIPEYSLFTYGSSYWDQKFKGEESFTQAIIDVTKEKEANIYFIKGHGEYSLDKDLYRLRESLTGEGYNVDSINLAEKGIPDDAHMLVVAGPERDYNEMELKLIKEFADRGGDLILMLDPLVNKNMEETKNLKDLLKEWGLELHNDLVVDRRQSYFFDPFTLIADINYHQITEKLKEEELSVILPMARSIDTIDNYEGDYQQKAVLKTSSYAWGEVNYLEDKITEGEDDLRGPLNLAYAVTRTISNTEKENNNSNSGNKGIIDKEMKAIILGTSAIIDNKILPQQGNQDFILNCVNWLSGNENKISIRPKGLGIRFISFTPVVGKTIFYGTVFVIPLIIFVIGSVIWFRRRNL